MSLTHPIFGPFTHPQTVGSISAIDQLPEASELKDQCDIVEFRLDALVSEPSKVVESAIAATSEELPVLITARRKHEGGANDLNSEQRSLLIRKFSTKASFVDIEIASAAEMREILDYIQSSNLKLVLSAHDFDLTPPPSSIREKIQQAHNLGADIAKIAVFHHSLADLHSVAHLMQDCFPSPVSLMGMGDLAPVSRVLFAQLGSVLNYGYLGDTPTAPGQWPVKLLKQAILHSKSLS